MYIAYLIDGSSLKINNSTADNVTSVGSTVYTKQ